MAKPVIKFRTYRQAPAVGGRIYGVPNLGDPVVAEVTMQEVIDYAKLHNYSADTLSALLSQVIAGVGDLVARDGRPRMLSDLLKFEPVIKGTFDNMEQTVTRQKVLVRPRMLKEIKVALDPSAYSWRNENDVTAPKIISVAPDTDDYSDVTAAAFLASLGQGHLPFAWTLAGARLFPNGWTSDASFEVTLDQYGQHRTLHFESFESGSTVYGVFENGDVATENAFEIAPSGASQLTAWYLAEGATTPTSVAAEDVTIADGDRLRFAIRRRSGTGDMFETEKTFVLFV